MKRLYFILLLLVAPCIQNSIIFSENKPIDDILIQNTEFNRLNWIDVSKGSYATQIIFDFAQPIYFKKKIKADALQLRLSFPGMQLRHFDKKQVLAKLNQLKELGLVTHADIFEKNTKFPKVVITIDFARTRDIKTDDDQTQTIKNSLLIKWCKMEDPHRLILDIFTQETLNNLKDKNSIILHAYNNSVQSDIMPTGSGLFPCKKKGEPLRIVLDAGHGGPHDEGATCYGLKEKDLALDIALKTRSLLKKRGFSTFLTRNTDKEISLAERTEFAQQLKANLFVSIHINSGGRPACRASGIETFYLNAKELLPPTREGGFLFVNLERDIAQAKMVDQFLFETVNQSKKLATAIQQNVLATLNQEKYSVLDRGVKSQHFRVFFNNPTPTALVEVGFITNKEEARCLANDTYRQLIAKGICNGIQKFILAQS